MPPTESGIRESCSHLEIDEALVGIPARQSLTHVLIDFSIVVLAVLEPPEPFRTSGHVLDHRLVIESLVAVDDHLSDRDAVSLLHIEHESHASRILRDLDGLDLGGVVAGTLVERIDCRPPLFDGVPVDRPSFRKLDPTLDLAFRQLLNAPNRPLPEDRPLLDPERQDQPVTRGALLRDHVVELPSLEQGGDGALNVAVVEWLVNDDTRRCR